MKNRTKEEIDSIMQSFPDVFEDQTGRLLTKEAIILIVETILKEKEETLIKQRFCDLSIRDLRTILKKLNEQKKK